MSPVPFSLRLRRTGMLIPAACIFLTLAGAGSSEGQTSGPLPRPAARTTKYPRGSIVIGAGVLVPLSHKAILDFWSPGPSIAVTAYKNVNRYVALGLGGEAALLRFDTTGFAQTYPGVPQHPLDLGYLHLYVAWKYTMLPASSVSPILGATIGASKMTKALYQVRIDGVRTTYYEIPGRLRLTAGGTLGFEAALSRKFALGAEGHLLYLVNDPEASVLVTGRLNARFSLE